MRRAMRESLQLAPPKFEVGARVTVALPETGYRFAGTVRSCRAPPTGGRPLYSVELDGDDELLTDLLESDLKTGPGEPGTAAAPPLATRPSADLLQSTREHLEKAPLPPPPASLAEDLCPGGRSHCGGDLCFPNLTLAHEAADGRFRMPLFMMAPGAVALFAGATLCHCTTGHHEKAQRKPQCEAHISFAVQTPATVLGLGGQPAKRHELHNRLLELGTNDLRERWHDAVWLPVWHFRDKPSPHARLDYSESEMCVLRWRRIVLYDAELGRDHPRAALVAYSVDGGLPPAAASHARSHFGFLAKEWQFVLHRHNNETERSGCLHLDGRGEQRMEMLGVHDRRRNTFQPPDKTRSPSVVKVANRKADLDAYVVHMDSPAQFGGAALKPTWESISARMRDLMPSSMDKLKEALEKAHVRERLYTTLAGGVVSDDLIVNNVGVSSEYQSPPHFDVGDVGWTCAFAVKCGEIDHDHSEIKQDHSEIGSSHGVDNGEWLRAGADASFASGLTAIGNHERCRMPRGRSRKHSGGVCFVEGEAYSACRLAEGCLLEAKHAGLCVLHFLERGKRRRTAQ